MTPPLRRGEFVRLLPGAGEPLAAMVVLASPNGRSVIVMYDGILGGHVAAAALSEDEGSADLETLGRFRTLGGLPVTVQRGAACD